MRTFCIAIGCRVRIEARSYLIDDKVGDQWQLTNLDTRETIEATESELLLQYELGVLEEDVIVQADSRGRDLSLPSVSFADLPAADQERIDLIQSLIARHGQCAIEGRITEKLPSLNPFSNKVETLTRLQHAINQECFSKGLDRSISVPTYYRLRKMVEDTGDVTAIRNRLKFRGRRPWMNLMVRAAIEDSIENTLQVARSRRFKGYTPRSLMKLLRLSVEDRLRSQGCKLKPSSASLSRAVKKLPLFEQHLLKGGYARLKIEFRGPSAQQLPEFALDLTEYDETETDIYLYIDGTGIILGRAIIGWLVCRVTGMPLGMSIGYEQMSDITTVQTLKHAVIPKNYMRRLYPDINGTWPSYGIPRNTVYDNGLTQHAKTIRQIHYDLNSWPIWAEAYRPMQKSGVENMHNLLNKLVLERQPGHIPQLLKREPGYDPKKNGFMGIRQFAYVTHKWLADALLVQRPVNGGQSRLECWNESVAKRKPFIPAKVQELDLPFGIFRDEATLDHRGVRIENSYYIAEWMHWAIKQFGSSCSVSVTIDPGNMGYILVRCPDLKWRRARAKNFKFLNGKSLREVERASEFARQKFDSTEEAAIEAAYREIWRLGQEILENSKSVEANSLVARTFGISLATIIGRTTDLDGYPETDSDTVGIADLPNWNVEGSAAVAKVSTQSNLAEPERVAKPRRRDFDAEFGD